MSEMFEEQEKVEVEGHGHEVTKMRMRKEKKKIRGLEGELALEPRTLAVRLDAVAAAGFGAARAAPSGARLAGLAGAPPSGPAAPLACVGCRVAALLGLAQRVRCDQHGESVVRALQSTTEYDCKLVRL